MAAVRDVDTHVTPRERAAFQLFLDDGYVDVVRPHTPGPDVFTYWDYYRQRFERNRGLRIDFVLASPSLAERVTGAVHRPRRARRQGRLRPRPGDRRPRLTAQGSPVEPGIPVLAATPSPDQCRIPGQPGTPER